MKISKLIFALLMVLLLAACQGKTEALGNFATEIDEGIKAEVGASEKIHKEQNSLESEKVELFNKINKAKQMEVKGYAEKLLDNADARSKTIDEEIKVMAESEKKYRSAKSLAEGIKDDKQKKELDAFVKLNDKKYVKHNNLMTSYKDILISERDVFNYLKQPNPKSKVVNDKIKQVSKKYDQFHKNTTEYGDLLKLIDEQKEKMTDILNGK